MNWFNDNDRWLFIVIYDVFGVYNGFSVIGRY